MIPKYRAWDKIDKEMYLVDEINFNRGEFESIGDGITFLRDYRQHLRKPRAFGGRQ